jgi:TonB-linked SusC/RagA family outer membrane protein
MQEFATGKATARGIAIAPKLNCKTKYRYAVLVMKLTAILLLVGCLQLSARGISQTITLSVKDADLQTVFTAIEKQTDYVFFVKKQLLQNAKKVTIKVSGASLQQVLDLCFKDQPFTYLIAGKMITISPKNGKASVEENIQKANQTGLLMDVKGRVVNENGEPVLASVTVKGTTKGTTTNKDGWFVLTGIDENSTLIISGVGIETTEVKANGKTLLNIAVKISIRPLDEVQMIAYGQTTRRLQTGNVSSVKSSAIETQPVQNPLLALQGRVPGLLVTQNSSVPGGTITVRIQGQNSIQNGNDPLYVIDGVPVPSQLAVTGMAPPFGFVAGTTVTSFGNPLYYLDMNSIESIDVLKDADATAIYGSRAANGAILITTKKGKVGRTSCEVNMQTGIGQLMRRLKMMNTSQYLDMRYEALKNDGIPLSSLNQNANYDLTVWDTTQYTDWQKELLGGTARYNNVTVSLQGGTTAMQYRISGNYHKETTVFPGDFADEKASMNFAITNKSGNGKFNLVFSGNYLWDKTKLPDQDLTQAAIVLAPDAPSVLNDDGTINWAPNNSGISTFTFNPILSQIRGYENTTDNLVSSLSLNYSLSKELTVKANFGYNILRSSEFSSTPLIAVPPERRSNPQQRNATYGDRQQSGWNIEPQVSYNKRIKNHQFYLLAGVTFTSNTINAGSITGYDHLSDELLRSRAAASTLTPGYQSLTQYRYNAIFGRASYNYLNKYLINLNGRRDGSSRFGIENKFENFGSIGGAWIFTEEGFLKRHSNYLSFGKLKFSYGTTGSDQVADYNYLSLYSLQGVTNLVLYQGVRGLQPNGLPNPYLQWEKTKKFNTGVDLGFFDNRILLNVNYSINRSSNQLLQYALASTAGFQLISSNFPALIENRSWELALNTENIKGKNLQWTSSFNLTIPRNKLVDFPNLESSSYALKLAIGQPVNVIRGYGFAGVNPTTGTYEFYTKDGGITEKPTDNDVIYLNKSPKYYGGFGNSIKYKNFQLDFLFQFVKQLGQNLLFNNGILGSVPGAFSTSTSNQPISVLNRWQKPGDETLIAKFTTNFSVLSNFGYLNLSPATITDASYVRLKNMSLSYIIPQASVKRIGLTSGRIFFQAQNLLTITYYKGLDPENQGISSLPPIRVMTLGVQFNF